jgi:hypothetical protein
MMADCHSSALARRFDPPHPVGWPEPVGSATHEGLDPGDFRVTQAVQFRQFNDPDPAGLHGSILAAQVRQFVGEVFAGECPQRCRLTDPLRAFEDETAIRLRTGAEDASDG